MRDLNDAVRHELHQVHYATMVAVGWHERRRLLVVTNAGHPPPLWFRAAAQQWSWLDTAGVSTRARPAGVPLGLLEAIDYERRVVKAQRGDIVVLYSDGVSEALSGSGEELGRDGLMTLARALDRASAEAFGNQLLASLAQFRGQAEPVDDQTIIVLLAT
jgi:sigma-B regulation protein RsbU (phosphoserine phosphatase)